ncbi:MAG TPA: serine/threonine-protein kinase [Gemmataceae bacterium]|nr:serine/threonine-protein kinase [Gemmataceae bacterium]
MESPGTPPASDAPGTLSAVSEKPQAECLPSQSDPLPELKLPPLIPFKPKSVAPPEPQIAKTTKVELIVPTPSEIQNDDLPPPPEPADAKAAPAVDAPAGQLLMPWSDDLGAQTQVAAKPIAHGKDPSTAATHVPAPPGYAVFEFLSPCEKAGFLGAVGQFRVRELIGEGGMGYVFLAEDKYLKRPVALKVMKPRVARKKRCWGWFLDEARATSALQSDRMATVYHIGEHRGVLYLAMELLYGESLESRLNRGPLPLDRALWIAKEAAHGLALVHRIGIFHRDIKPANLWLSVPRDVDQKGADVLRTYGDRKSWMAFSDQEYSGVKILDFGLARLNEGGRGKHKRGEVQGTPWYMAPEQARGESGDARSDLFSFGVVLYRMLSGQLPFNGQTPLEVLTAIVSSTPTPVSQLNSNIPHALGDLTVHLLATDPLQRPDSALEVIDSLSQIERALAAADLDAKKSNSRSSIWRRVFRTK